MNELRDREPVGRPEQVLLRVQQVMPKGRPEFWMIHTDRRMYVTDKREMAEVAMQAHDGKREGVRVKIAFDPRQTPRGVANVITKIALVGAAASPLTQFTRPRKQPRVVDQLGAVTILSFGEGLEMDTFTVKTWGELFDRLMAKYAGRPINWLNVDCR